MIPKHFCKTIHFYESSTYTFFILIGSSGDSCWRNEGYYGPNANLSKSDAGYYGFLDSNLSLSFQG